MPPEASACFVGSAGSTALALPAHPSNAKPNASAAIPQKILFFVIFYSFAVFPAVSICMFTAQCG
jgi:hypothetical protein